MKKLGTAQRKKWLQALRNSDASSSRGGSVSSVVVDANVWYSAIAYGGIPEQAVLDVLQKRRPVVSAQIVEEVIERFAQDHAPRRWLNALEAALIESVVVVANYVEQHEVRDPKDMHVIAACLESGATYLLTGDKDLLEMVEVGEYVALSPQKYIEAING